MSHIVFIEIMGDRSINARKATGGMPPVEKRTGQDANQPSRNVGGKPTRPGAARLRRREHYACELGFQLGADRYHRHGDPDCNSGRDQAVFE
jgi:hypothetical protein